MVRVRAHIRKTKHGMTTVKEHTRKTRAPKRNYLYIGLGLSKATTWNMMKDVHRRHALDLGPVSTIVRTKYNRKKLSIKSWSELPKKVQSALILPSHIPKAQRR